MVPFNKRMKIHDTGKKGYEHVINFLKTAVKSSLSMQLINAQRNLKIKKLLDICLP